MLLPSISKTRLELLTLLSQKPRTPSELYKLLGKSLPTVTKHLAYLEDFRLVERVGEQRGRTRPYIRYALRETAILVKVTKGDVGIISLPLNEMVKVQLRIWSIPQQIFHYSVERFFWQIQDLMPSITAIAVFGSVAKGNAREDSDIDFLILATKDVAKIKKRCEAVVVKKPTGEAKMVMAQVFENSEFRQAHNSGSEFAKEVIESMLPIYDPDLTLASFKVSSRG